MNQNKKGSINSLTCNVCKVDLSSNADYALHEFSKKHCDNLIRLAKRKPIVSKKKSKSFEEKKESSKTNTLTQTGSFAKYGYFIPGETYAHAETSKEFNTDYDPYFQKLAENPFKEKPVIPTPETNLCPGSSFSKKRKKKIRKCQICDVIMSTVPEYEAHMKSAQHIWKLKITGMGVSAHFIKASTDLHTTDINRESISTNQINNEQISVKTTVTNKNLFSESSPLLYCSDCELFLSSLQQYNTHINSKFHIDCAQKNAESTAKKEKFENLSPNQLYCYSCKISLNNLFQYNEHKNGKKHRTKCRNLIKKGITIPPEERVPGIPLSNPKRPIVYPELYEKLILEKQKLELKPVNFLMQKDLSSTADFSVSFNHHTENHLDIQESSRYSEIKEMNSDYCTKSTSNLEVQNENKATMAVSENNVSSNDLPKIIVLKNDANTLVNTSTLNNNNTMLVNNSQTNISNFQRYSPSDMVKPTEKELKSEIKIIINNESVKCSICNENFQSQAQLDMHLGTEAHLNKILELKMKGKCESEILSAIFSDRNIVKPCRMGKLTCSVCTITADNTAEFDQHLNSIFHKYTLKDYRMRRTLEVKNMVPSNEQGLYFCKSCKEGWSSLIEYTQHLHSLKHRTSQKAQRAKVILAKRRISHLQKQKLKSLKKSNTSLRRIETEKNHGIRTKACGVAVDLQRDIQASVPNLEPLEPKTDLTKNSGVGTCENGNNNTASRNNNNNYYYYNNLLKKTNINKTLRSDRKLQNLGPNQKNNGFYPAISPFMPPRNIIPQLLPCSSYQPRFSRSSNGPTNKNWAPYSSLYSPVFEPFYGRSSSNPHVRPSWFQRAPWSRHK